MICWTEVYVGGVHRGRPCCSQTLSSHDSVYPCAGDSPTVQLCTGRVSLPVSSLLSSMTWRVLSYSVTWCHYQHMRSEMRSKRILEHSKKFSLRITRAEAFNFCWPLRTCSQCYCPCFSRFPGTFAHDLATPLAHTCHPRSSRFSSYL